MWYVLWCVSNQLTFPCSDYLFRLFLGGDASIFPKKENCNKQEGEDGQLFDSRNGSLCSEFDKSFDCEEATVSSVSADNCCLCVKNEEQESIIFSRTTSASVAKRPRMSPEDRNTTFESLISKSTLPNSEHGNSNLGIKSNENIVSIKHSGTCPNENKIVEKASTSQHSSKDVAFDINRTGAKCVPSGEQDLHLEGAGYHVIGPLRTKPGRGERTLSMSCSDKIMKWCILGLQGGLIANFVQSPIYLSSVVIGKCPFDQAATTRAFSLRGRQLETTSAKYSHRSPNTFFCHDEEFSHSKNRVEADWNPRLGKIAASGASKNSHFLCLFEAYLLC